MDILTVSSCTDCQLCQQLYAWKYELCLRPTGQPASEALSVGNAFHSGMDAANLDDGLAKVEKRYQGGNALGPEQFFKQDEEKAKVRAMTRRAWMRWPERPAVQERTFDVPIINPETGSKSRTFRFCGKFDGMMGDWLLDYKTTADPVQFIMSQRLGYQLTGYIYGASEGGEKTTIENALYRIVTRPTLRRGGITKKRKEVETPEEYEARCYEWLGQDGKIVEEEVWFTEASLQAFIGYLWQLTQSILWARRSGAWLRNVLACKHWNRTCEYLGLCLQVAGGKDMEKVNTDGYEVTDPHPELAKE